MVGAEIGGEVGSVGGPIGIAADAIVGYEVGDLSHQLLAEPWGKDREQYARSWALVPVLRETISRPDNPLSEPGRQRILEQLDRAAERFDAILQAGQA
jgi:hypothetical protein